MKLVIRYNSFIIMLKLINLVSSWNIKDLAHLLSKNNYFPLAHQMQLPLSIKIHHIFNVFLIEHYTTINISWRKYSSLPYVKIDNKKKLEVEEVLVSMWFQNKFEYLKHWHKYHISKCTWELYKNKANALEFISIFYWWYQLNLKINRL